LASKEREAKIKSKYRVSDEVNKAQIKDCTTKLAEARAKKKQDKKARLRANSRRY
jgi:hypothetical protein